MYIYFYCYDLQFKTFDVLMCYVVFVKNTNSTSQLRK